MPLKITIIGLGQVGASIGLALGKIKDQAVRYGNDREPANTRQAQHIGAIDKTTINLPTSVQDADMIILAVPVDEIRETIEVIAEDLKPGALLIDTSPVKGAVMDWAKELLPGEDRYFVALTPSINPAYLTETGGGIERAHADLFEKSLFLITTLPGTDESAITLATNLVTILGATPLFADTSEADGLMAYSHLLPGLVSAALVNATIDQPGWREARKVAGRAYTQATDPAQFPIEAKELGKAALLNAGNTIRMIDQLMDELAELRSALVDGNQEKMAERLEHARQGREQWWQQRLAGEWERRPTHGVDLPTSGESIGRLFGIRPKRERERKS